MNYTKPGGFYHKFGRGDGGLERIKSRLRYGGGEKKIQGVVFFLPQAGL